MEKETFRALFKDASEGNDERDHEFRAFFKSQVKESIRDMFDMEELSVEADIECDYYDSKELVVKVKMGNQTVCERSCWMR